MFDINIEMDSTEGGVNPLQPGYEFDSLGKYESRRLIKSTTKIILYLSSRKLVPFLFIVTHEY